MYYTEITPCFIPYTLKQALNAPTDRITFTEESTTVTSKALPAK